MEDQDTQVMTKRELKRARKAERKKARKKKRRRRRLIILILVLILALVLTTPPGRRALGQALNGNFQAALWELRFLGEALVDRASQAWGLVPSLRTKLGDFIDYIANFL